MQEAFKVLHKPQEDHIMLFKLMKLHLGIKLNVSLFLPVGRVALGRARQ